MSRTCFVICPIGEEGSPTRQRSDDVLDLIIDPALESLGFEIIRADRIVGAGVITAEVVELVQTADLCIVDLTDHNANVFYECGRRHETARPFIQIIQKDQKPPFDVSTIRTIPYNLSSARAAREASLQVRKYAEAIVRNPTANRQTSMSATSIADALDRVERKIDKLSLVSARSAPPALAAGGGSLVEEFARSLRRSPSDEFFSSIAGGDMVGAERALLELRDSDGLGSHVVAAAGLVASAGLEGGASILFEVVDTLPTEAPEGGDGIGKDAAYLSLVNYFVRRRDPVNGLARLRGAIAGAFADESASAEARGRLANSLEMLAYSAQDYHVAAEWGERACALSPEEATYFVNLSMCHEALGNLGKAKDAIDRGVTPPFEKCTSAALSQGIDVYEALGDSGKVSDFLAALVVVDPARARVKKLQMELGQLREAKPDLPSIGSAGAM